MIHSYVHPGKEPRDFIDPDIEIGEDMELMPTPPAGTDQWYVVFAGREIGVFNDV